MKFIYIFSKEHFDVLNEHYLFFGMAHLNFNACGRDWYLLEACEFGSMLYQYKEGLERLEEKMDKCKRVIEKFNQDKTGL